MLAQCRQGNNRHRRRMEHCNTSDASKTMVLVISNMGQRNSDSLQRDARQHAHSSNILPCKLGASASATTRSAHLYRCTQGCRMSNVGRIVMVVGGGMQSMRPAHLWQHRKESRRHRKGVKCLTTSDATKTMVPVTSNMDPGNLGTLHYPAMQHAHTTNSSPCKLAVSAFVTIHCTKNRLHMQGYQIGNVANPTKVVPGGMLSMPPQLQGRYQRHQ